MSGAGAGAAVPLAIVVFVVVALWMVADACCDMTCPSFVCSVLAPSSHFQPTKQASKAKQSKASNIIRDRDLIDETLHGREAQRTGRNGFWDLFVVALEKPVFNGNAHERKALNGSCMRRKATDRFSFSRHHNIPNEENFGCDPEGNRSTRTTAGKNQDC